MVGHFKPMMEKMQAVVNVKNERSAFRQKTFVSVSNVARPGRTLITKIQYY